MLTRIGIVVGRPQRDRDPRRDLPAGPAHAAGRESHNAADQTQVNILLSVIMTPIVILVWVVFGYSILNFRQRGEQIEDGAPIRGNSTIQSRLGVRDRDTSSSSWP